jgi:tRNA threonylcarbamoyladenosine biosynthesis protein TsaB
MALEKPLIHIPTVDGLAYNLAGCADVVCPLMDARRSQTYTGLYEFEQRTMHTLLPQCAVAIEEIIKKINELGRRTVFLGDGVPVFQEVLKEQLQVPYYFAPPNNNKQRAASVVSLAFSYAKEGKFETAAQHAPDYLRLSQAERERAEKGKLEGDKK